MGNHIELKGEIICHRFAKCTRSDSFLTPSIQVGVGLTDWRSGTVGFSPILLPGTSALEYGFGQVEIADDSRAIAVT